ncbi:MAG TPA: hypothetical protein VMY35_12280 [Phycisphaerae bacterium]|nr:hypothetical protein [Phycisphaerae bacterium]
MWEAIAKIIAAIAEWWNRRDERRDPVYRREQKEKERDAFEKEVDKEIASGKPGALGRLRRLLRRLRATKPRNP